MTPESPTVALAPTRLTRTLQMDEVVRLSSGRNVRASVAIRVTPETGASGPFMTFSPEHVESLVGISVHGEHVVSVGEDLVTRLAGGELSRLARQAEALWFRRVRATGAQAQPFGAVER